MTPKDRACEFGLSPSFGAGYSRCFIPAGQDSSEGRLLGNFYNYYRINWELTIGQNSVDGFVLGYNNNA